MTAERQCPNEISFVENMRPVERHVASKSQTKRKYSTSTKWKYRAAKSSSRILPKPIVFVFFCLYFASLQLSRCHCAQHCSEAAKNQIASALVACTCDFKGFPFLWLLAFKSSCTNCMPAVWQITMQRPSARKIYYAIVEILKLNN